MDLSQNQTPIQQNSQPNPYPPDQNVPTEKKSNWTKTCLIIFIILIILGSGGYLGYKYYFIKLMPSTSSQVTKATVDGTKDKITVELPPGYAQMPKKVRENSDSYDLVIIYNPAYNQNPAIDHLRLFSVGFYSENPTNDYKKGIEKMRAVFEEMNSRGLSNMKISEVDVNNFRLLKTEDKLKNDDGSDFAFLTDYWIFTNDSYFNIRRVNPLGEPNFDEDNFNKVLNSFKITPK